MVPRACLPTDAWVRRLLVPVVVFMAMVSDQGYLCDFWHHLARGRAMGQLGMLLDHDIFTYTVTGQSFQDLNWLSQLAYYGLFELGGLALVQVVNALTMLATMALLIDICAGRVRRTLGIAKEDALFWASLTAVGVFLGVWQLLSVRPQTFSMFLFVLLLLILDHAERRPRLLALAPLVIALWTNLHGAFPAGLMLIGCFLLAEVWRQWRDRAGASFLTGVAPFAGCLAISTLATLVNPYGWGIYRYVLHTSHRAAARQIDEWLPPSLDSWVGKAFAISLIVLAVLSLAGWRKGRRPSVRDVLLMGCFLLLAATSVRMVAWWLFVLAPVVTVQLAALVSQPSQAREMQPSLGAGLTFAALLLAALFSLPGLQVYNPILSLRMKPRVEEDLAAAHAYLQGLQSKGRVFSRFEWGEYLGWACNPDFPVFMDGRIELYPDDVWNHYATVTRGAAGWQKVLDDYQVDLLFVDAEYHRRTGLLDEINRATQWRKQFTSRNVLVYSRANSTLIVRGQ